jgi:protein-disulfide isomerase
VLLSGVNIGARACLLILMLGSAPVALAEPLQQGTGEAILAELKAVRAALERIEKAGAIAPQRPQAAATASVNVKGRPAMGDAGAPVTLVEFTDYQCPFCVRFTTTTFAQLKQAYVDTGKLRIVVKDMPLAMHANARRAAQASHCAGEQDAYWPMHLMLFDNYKQLNEESLPGYAAQLQLDVEAFSACLTSDRHLQSISSDMQEAKRAGISGTPSFVLGASNGDTVQGNIIRGAQSFDNFKQQIEALLAEQAEG